MITSTEQISLFFLIFFQHFYYTNLIVHENQISISNIIWLATWWLLDTVQRSGFNCFVFGGTGNEKVPSQSNN